VLLAREAFWSAAALRRFRPRATPTHKRNASFARKSASALGAFPNAGANAAGLANAKHPAAALRRSRPRDAYASTKRIARTKSVSALGALPDAAANAAGPRERASVLECGGPPPLLPARDAHA